MRKGKMYRKFLSCVLAAAMVVTGGMVYPGNGKAALAAEIEASFKANNAYWYVVDDGDGVLLDSQGVRYQLNKDGITAVVCGFGYDGSNGPAQSTVVKISETVPINYIDYIKYKQNGDATVFNGTGSRTPSKVTAIEAEAFLGSLDLTEVTVPATVVSIGNKAFASCPELTGVEWEVDDTQEVTIGSDMDDLSVAEILEDSPKGVLTSKGNTFVDSYAEKYGYDNPREESSSGSATSSDAPSGAPDTAPTETPIVTPSTMPTATPSVTPSAVPTVAPATPVVTPGVVPTVTPAVPTSTPKVTLHPVVPAIPSKAPIAPTPAVTASPAVLTPAPVESAVPTVAPTEAPATQKPAITEVPAVPEPVVTEKPAETTPVPVPAQPTAVPEKVVVKDNVSYEVNQGTKSVSVSNMNDVKSSTVTIPSTVKVDGVSYKVTSVDKNAFKNNTKITNVQIGKNVTKIDEGAFQGCKKLTSVKLPSKLTTISKNSFNGCSSLKTVKIPKTVTKIGKAAFKNCTSLKNVSIGDNPKKKTGGLSFDESQIRYGASTVTINIGEKAFENCKKLNKVIINALVKVIGKSAFKDCKSLRSVLIYSKVLKEVKGGALTGVNNCKISVPAKKVAPYKILFKNKGQGKKVVVAKL